MKKKDLEYIIFESRDKIDKYNFFKTKRSNCLHSEYSEGLKKSFKRLEALCDNWDRYHYRLVTIDGKVFEGTLTKNSSAYEAEYLYLEQQGKVDLPFKISIDLKKITCGKFKYKLTAEILAEIKPAIDA